MSQLTKTLCFVGAALVSTVLALASRPGNVSVETARSDQIVLCPDFKDPLTAQSLKIVRFDETLASLSEIEVKETSGIWTLPSHDNYPADAKDRIRNATTPFIELKSVAWVTDNDGEHSLYGVLEPSADKSTVGDQGVGTLVTVKGENGKDLVDLIIGKKDKDIPEQRYVRQRNRSSVYLAKVNPDDLPVRFENWIEKDLLQLNSWDVQQLVLKDYTFQIAATLSGPVTDFDQRLEMTVSDENGKWKLDQLLVPSDDRLEPAQLGPNEELNKERLDGLKEALDSLEIVNVERKPASLGADLRTENGFANDKEGIQSLFDRGFYPVQMPDGHVEMLSAEGEVLARTKEGVEYVLRFGGVEGVDTEATEQKVNRFLLVMARVHDAHFPEPQLERVPETIEELQQAEAAKQPAESEKPAEDKTSASDAPRDLAAGLTRPVALLQDEQAADETNADAGAAQPTATEASDSQADAPQTPPAVSTPSPTTTPDQATVAEPTEQPKETSTPAAGAAPAATGESTEPAKPAEVDWDAKLKSERERITKENQRKIDERKDKLAKATDKVRELNYRFADWYYVISDDVYKKIHLSNTDIIQEAKPKTETDTETETPAVPEVEPGLDIP